MRNRLTYTVISLIILMPIFWSIACSTHLHVKTHSKKEWLKKNKIFLDLLLFFSLIVILLITFYLVTQSK